LVKSTVNDHWCTQLTTLAQLYKGLQYLSNHNLSKCKIHPILKHRCYSSLDISRIPVKLRPVTGTYVLQTKRIKYYRNESDPTCLLCGAAEENVLHFILQCEKLVGESSFTVRDQRYMATSQFIVMDSWAIPGRLSLPPFRNVSTVSSLLSVFCLYHSPEASFS
jgi:hypothetical protein